MTTTPPADQQPVRTRLDMIRSAGYSSTGDVGYLLAELGRVNARAAEERAVNDHLIGKMQATLDAADEWLAERAQLLADNHKLAAELGRVRAELATTQAELGREVRQHGQTINERDDATDMADRLAAAIASEDVIGEHSGGNCPWTNALEYASEQAHLAEQPQSRPVRHRPCEGGEFGQCRKYPAWAVREKGDRSERNWSFACAQHFNRVARQHGERAEIDLVRIAAL